MPCCSVAYDIQLSGSRPGCLQPGAHVDARETRALDRARVPNVGGPPSSRRMQSDDDASPVPRNRTRTWRLPAEPVANAGAAACPRWRPGACCSMPALAVKDGRRTARRTARALPRVRCLLHCALRDVVTGLRRTGVAGRDRRTRQSHGRWRRRHLCGGRTGQRVENKCAEQRVFGPPRACVLS